MGSLPSGASAPQEKAATADDRSDEDEDTAQVRVSRAELMRGHRRGRTCSELPFWFLRFFLSGVGEFVTSSALLSPFLGEVPLLK